ncbi:DUF7666 domain-containing protein [Lysobacter olei]
MADGTTQESAATETTAQPEVITTFKGFDANLACRGYQFEVGKEFVHEGEVSACNGGFHACEYPLDVFNYYPPAESRYCTVEQSGTLSRHGGDSKVASERIKLTAEIGLPGIIKAAVEYTLKRAKPTDSASNSGDYGAASNSGEDGAASNSGTRGAASNSGARGAASNSGYQGAASNSGTRGAASNSGDYGAASNSGYQGAASNSGARGAASNSGYQGAASNSGARGAASNSGEDGVAMSAGYAGKVMGCEGSALFLVERDDEYKIVAVWSGIAGRDGVKPETWYTLRDGNLVEV